MAGERKKHVELPPLFLDRWLSTRPPAFLLLRSLVVEGRVDTLAIIEPLDVGEQRRAGVIAVGKGGMVGPRVLERAEETLHDRVVVTVALARLMLGTSPCAVRHAW